MTGLGTEPRPGPAAAPRGRDLWRAARTPVIIGGIMLAAAVFIALLIGGSTRGRLDPEATDGSGSRAVAQLLSDRGVHVITARTVAQARTAARTDATLLITRTGYFGRHGLTELSRLPGDRVVVRPTGSARPILTPQITGSTTGSTDARAPGCDLRAARLAGTADLGGVLRTTAPGAVRCYSDGSGAGLIRYAARGRTITTLASGVPLTNDRLDARGNAALGLNLLGARPTVVWVCPTTPQPDSAAAQGPKPLLDVLPSSVELAAVQLAIAVLLFALWRARRLGPVAAERLPVVVRASETVEGRARLYRARRARGRAADALRSGFLARTVPLLGLPADAGDDATVAALAMRTGTDATYLHDLLYGAPPGDDPELVAFADRLDTLERQVRQP